jgi:hypothetical protein
MEDIIREKDLFLLRSKVEITRISLHGGDDSWESDTVENGVIRVKTTEKATVN